VVEVANGSDRCWQRDRRLIDAVSGGKVELISHDQVFPAVVIEIAMGGDGAGWRDRV
jgi:hypothetical protein